MPCPPSYEELRFMQLEHDLNRVGPSLKRQLAEIPATLELLSLVVLAKCSAEERIEVAHLHQRLLTTRDAGAQADFDFPQPDAWPEAEDLQRYDDFVTALDRLDQTAELELCEARTFLCAKGRRLIPAEKWESPQFLDQWRLAMESHRLHREADRAAASAIVQKNIDYYLGRPHQADLSPTQRASAAEILLENQEKLARIQAIPIETLMADRYILFR